MRKYLEVAAAGLTAIVSHPLRSVVTIACLLAALTPYVAATGLSQGIHRDARSSIEAGALPCSVWYSSDAWPIMRRWL